MGAYRSDGAATPCLAAPEAAEQAPRNDEALRLAGTEGFREQAITGKGDSRRAGLSDQDLLAVEGEEYAQAFLDRLADGTAQPGELGVILAFLQGEMLHGACRLIEKTLGGCHE